MKLTAPEMPAVVPLEFPDRFRLEIVYFMTPPGESGAPPDLSDRSGWRSNP